MMQDASPADVRRLIRQGEWAKPTSGLCLGRQQANLVILPQKHAADFEEFCDKNSQSCPLLAVLPAGVREPKTLAPGADVATDLPKYRVWKQGELVEEVTDVSGIFREDMVSFFLGCSFGFERALQEHGIEVRNITEGKNVSMYKTNRECTPVGPFHCPMVVSMRPVHKDRLQEVINITGSLPAAHGPPVHFGDPKELGIEDINNVDFGDAVTIKEDEVPVFWACGVTSSLAALSVKPDLAITHSPGCMFITDLPDYAPGDKI